MSNWFIDEGGNLRVVNTIFAIGAFVVVCTVLGIVGTYTGLVVNWTTVPATIAAPRNVQSEFEWFYSQSATLRTLKANRSATDSRIASLTKTWGDDSEKWPSATKSEYKQLTDMRAQQDQLYNNACGQYQARWDNIFHNLVAPRDIPRDCEMIQ